MTYAEMKQEAKAEVGNRMSDTIVFYMMEYGRGEILDFTDVAIVFQEAMEQITNQLADE
jgi:hypothetical protein